MKIVSYIMLHQMKKLIFATLVALTLFFAPRVNAEEANQEIICPQPYGGGVVCGVHVPVNTGIGDNLALIGAGLLGSSGVIAFFSRKIRKSA